MDDRPHLKQGSALTQWALLAAALLIIGVVVGWNLYADRNAIDAGERDRLAHSARVIEDNLGQQLLATNLALESIRSDLPFLRRQEDSQALINRRLQAMSDAMPGMRTLFVTDAEGTMVASNRGELIGRNFREREYFQTARGSGNPAILHVSQPYKTVLGVFALNLTRVIPDERGGFGGMVGATLDPEYFKTLLDSARHAPKVWTGLVHGDGKVFLVVPSRPDIEGHDLAKPGSFFARHRDSGQQRTVMTGISSDSGDQLMMAQSTVNPASLRVDKPLFLAVARDLPSIFAAWRQNAYRQGALFAVLVLTSGLGLALFQRRQRYFDGLAAAHEAEQRRQTEQYRSIVQASLDGFWITDFRGRILDANESSCRMLGYSHEELLRLSISDIEADESADEIAARTREMKAVGHVQFEARHRCKDGSVINVEVGVQHLAAIGDRFFAFIRNITERKNIEATLRQSEARFRQMFENNESVMLLIDPVSGDIVDANAAAEHFYGYPAERLKAMRIDQINTLSPEEVAAQRAQAARHERHEFVFPHRLASGDVRTVEVLASPIDVGERVLLFSIVHDITQREIVTAELKRSNAELEQFSYAISHDMRQPLRMISSYMQLLETGLARQLDAEQRQFFGFAVDGAKRLDQMLIGLLEYSRVGRMGDAPAWVESREVLDDALLFLQPAIAQAQAGLSVTGDWPRIFAGRNEILRLMLNLIDNAIKFRIAGRTPEIIVTSEANDKQWLMSVADNGVGIVPGQIDRLFQVFQRLQLRADYDGTGIGLALCRKIAEHHGGRIWAESAGEGQGSCFRFELPRVSPP